LKDHAQPPKNEMRARCQICTRPVMVSIAMMNARP
jgi:hypothetical protein